MHVACCMLPISYCILHIAYLYNISYFKIPYYMCLPYSIFPNSSGDPFVFWVCKTAEEIALLRCHASSISRSLSLYISLYLSISLSLCLSLSLSLSLSRYLSLNLYILYIYMCGLLPSAQFAYCRVHVSCCMLPIAYCTLHTRII